MATTGRDRSGKGGIVRLKLIQPFAPSSQYIMDDEEFYGLFTDEMRAQLDQLPRDTMLQVELISH